MGEKINVPKFLEELDEIYSSGNLIKAEELLEATLSKARSIGDWSAELSVLSEMMGFYRRNSNKEKGLGSVRDGLSLIKTHSLENSISGATVMLNAATTLKAFSKADESIEIFLSVKDTFLQKLDPHDYRLAGLYNNMALSYVDLKDFIRAEHCYKNALDILSFCKNPECEMAVTYCNMAYMYHAENPEDGRIDEVMQKAQTCLECDKITKDGYYAFTASKCYSAFEFFGYFIYADKLKKISENIYESNR